MRERDTHREGWKRQNSRNHPIRTAKRNNFFKMRIVEGTSGKTSILTFTLSGYQEEEREKEAENLFEGIMTKNFLNLGKETDV